jgi:hypothetical protein
MEINFLDKVLNSEFAPKLIAFVIAIQLVLYALGEALTRISVYTENTWDNELAKKIAKFSWFLGVIISKFGYSVPKLIADEKKK